MQPNIAYFKCFKWDPLHTHSTNMDTFVHFYTNLHSYYSCLHNLMLSQTHAHTHTHSECSRLISVSRFSLADGGNDLFFSVFSSSSSCSSSEAECIPPRLLRILLFFFFTLQALVINHSVRGESSLYIYRVHSERLILQLIWLLRWIQIKPLKMP